MTQSTTDDLFGMLIIRLSDTDSEGQDIESQLRHKVRFVVDSAHISELLINLEGVAFLPSAALGQLIMLKKKCDSKQIKLGLCCISESNMMALRLVRFDTILDIYDDQASAVEALRTKVPDAPQQPMPAAELANLISRAESDDIDAQFELAQRMSNGHGVEPDPAQAMQWYFRAAEHNHRDAQYEMATCYAFGLGVDQDYGLAIPWYEKAAQQGHANAQYMLGMSFQYSLNDVKDPGQARQWYERAASQGHEKAKSALAEMAS
jgi:anti-anti-sigma factor